MRHPNNPYPDDIKSRRMAIAITEYEATMLMFGKTRFNCPELPYSAELQRTYLDPARQAFVFVFVHETFASVAPCAITPELKVEFLTIHELP